MPKFQVLLKDNTTKDFHGVVPFVGKAGELELNIDPSLHRWDRPMPPPGIIFAPGTWILIQQYPTEGEEVKESA